MYFCVMYFCLLTIAVLKVAEKGYCILVVLMLIWTASKGKVVGEGRQPSIELSIFNMLLPFHKYVLNSDHHCFIAGLNL